MSDRMGNIERSERRIEGLIAVAPHPGGDFHADILEVLRGRREQVESLRQQLAGAVEDAEALAHAISASLTHGERSPLATALSVYLQKHPWSDL